MSNTAQKPSLWPKAIIAYFSVVICGIAVFIAWAIGQNMDLVRKDYYAEELKFQQQLDSVNRTRQNHKTAAVNFESSSGIVRVSIPQANSTARGVIHFYRPSDAALDKSIKLSLTANGVQEIDGKELQPGFWKVRVNWSDGADEFFTESSIIVSEK